MSNNFEHEKNGELVVGVCATCGRAPFPGEKYGTGPNDWDFTNICSKCWDEITYSIDDDYEDDDTNDKDKGF